MGIEFHLEGKFARYAGDLEKALSRYSSDFEFQPPYLSTMLGIPEIAAKYKLKVAEGEGEDYSIVVSTTPFSEKIPYNIIISVGGPKRPQVKQLLKDLVAKMGFPTEPMPEELREFMEATLKQTLEQERVVKNN